MLSAKNLAYEVDGHNVFENVSFDVHEGDKIGLVGANGVGKTSLLGVLGHELEPRTGVIHQGELEVGKLPQDLNTWLEHSVYGFLEEVTGVKKAKTDFDTASMTLANDHSDSTLMLYQNAYEKVEKLDVYGFDARVERAMNNAGITQVDVDKTVGSLSGGQRTRVAMAAIFAARFDVLLLDEPTNNLDKEGVVMLEKYINGSNAGFVIVSHDRRFLRNATTRIIEMLGGNKGVKQYGLGYDEYLEARANDADATVKRYEEFQTEKRELRHSINQARVVANSAERGRASNDNDKKNTNYRSQRAAGHLGGKVGSLVSRLQDMQAPEAPLKDIDLSFMFSESQANIPRLASVENVTVSYSALDQNGKQEFGPYNLTVGAHDRIAITGANGTGKSTFIKTIINPGQASHGNVVINPATKIGYIDQNQSLPLPESNAYENLRVLAPNVDQANAMHLLAKFNLPRDVIATTPAEKLSGGQRAKVLLAGIAANKANLLVLDEPTNNLDIPTIEGLEKALRSYKGAIVLVSHDRDFMQEIGIDQEIKVDDPATKKLAI